MHKWIIFQHEENKAATCRRDEVTSIVESTVSRSRIGRKHGEALVVVGNWEHLTKQLADPKNLENLLLDLRPKDCR